MANSVVNQAIQNAKANLAAYQAALEALEAHPCIAGLPEVPTSDLVRRLTIAEIEDLEAALVFACEPLADFIYGETGARSPRVFQLERDAGDLNGCLRFLLDPLRHERERRYRVRAMRHAAVAGADTATAER